MLRKVEARVVSPCRRKDLCGLDANGLKPPACTGAPRAPSDGMPVPGSRGVQAHRSPMGVTFLSVGPV
jgi:hypothetical protein